MSWLLGSLIWIHGSNVEKSPEWLCMCVGCIRKETGRTIASSADTFNFRQLTNGVCGCAQFEENRPNICHSYLDWQIFANPCLNINGTYSQVKAHDTDELKQCMLNVWCGLKQSVINDTINKWCIRQFVCISAKGGRLSIYVDSKANFQFLDYVNSKSKLVLICWICQCFATFALLYFTR